LIKKRLLKISTKVSPYLVCLGLRVGNLSRTLPELVGHVKPVKGRIIGGHVNMSRFSLTSGN
jgi:hypothetical protein